MVRTRGDSSGYRVGQKASFKSHSTPSSSGSATKKGRGGGGGGNRYCPRETPIWQKEITQFFNAPQNNSNTEIPGPSTEAQNE